MGIRGAAATPTRRRMFQSPSLRGSGRLSVHSLTRCAERSHVSIPFIAGQWSLSDLDRAGETPPPLFQSPSLRGSGRFCCCRRGGGAGRCRFNPLHCGAVVAYGTPSPPEGGASRVSIPFIAGQWSLNGRGGGSAGAYRVSIPFIAGQWSLPASPHGGARGEMKVSIPFIAGQWSLLARQLRIGGRFQFQSPSLRGSGRFAGRKGGNV